MHCVQYLEKTEPLDRRRFLRLTGYGGLGLLVGGAGKAFASQNAVDPSRIKQMAFNVTYRAQMYNFPRDAKQVRVWMPLPPPDQNQEIWDLSVRCPVPHKITTSKLYGNRMIHVETDRLEPFVLEARYHVVRYQVGARWGDPSEALDPKYRQLSPPVRVTEEVAAFARKAVGKATRPVDVGRKIYDAMIDMLTYDKEIKGCGIGDTAWLMKYKRGKCDDYHALFMAAMVSQGIPVRWEQGFPLPYPSETEVTSGQLNGDCSGAHCWASFYDPEMGWVPVDVSEADKRPELHDFFFGNLTPNRFKISEGRAIFLTPRQGGQPLSTFAFAYAEADGIPLIYLANYENIIQFNITHIDTV